MSYLVERRKAGKFRYYGKMALQGEENAVTQARVYAGDPAISKLFVDRAAHYAELADIYKEMAEDAVALANAIAAIS